MNRAGFHGSANSDPEGSVMTVRAEAIEALRAIPLFEKIGDEDLAALAGVIIERRFPKNVTIVEEGLSGDYMYVICEGRVKVTKSSDDGREKILDILEAGSFFGDMALFDRAPRSASVKTLEASRLLALSRRDVLDVMRRSTDFSLAIIQVLIHRLRETGEQASAMSFQGVKARAKGLLTRVAEPQADGRCLTPSLTHQQIADMIGSSRETVTRVVKQLKQDDWLDQEGKRYIVSNEQAALGGR
jgi:CRP-like cAMP-binding protein